MSLRVRMILSVAAAAVLAAAAVGAPLWFGAERLVSEAAEQALESLERRLDTALEDEVERALSLAELVARQPEVGRAFADGDREALAAMFGPGFSAMTAAHGVKQFQFHLPPATSFLRVHKLDKFGDDLSGFRQTVLTANAEGRAVYGLERGRGGLGVRAVQPIRHQGALVGTVEFGLDFGGQFFERLAGGADTESEFYLYPAANVATFSDEDAAQTRQAATFSGAPLLDAATLAAVRRGETARTEVEIAGRPYFGLARPIKDYSGRVAGAAHVLTSTAAFTATEAQIARLAGLGAAAALLVALAMGVVFSGYVCARLKALSGRMGALAEGDVDTPIEGAEGSDEIAQMARALEVFRRNAAEVAHLREERDRSAAADAEARAAMVRRLSDEIGAVVAAVARGDFARRVACDFEEPDLNALGEAVNGLAGSVADSVGSVRRVLSALARGDLSERMQGSHQGDFAALQNDLNATADTLGRLISGISGAIDALKSTADAMAHDAHDMAERASGQAASLEETSATMEEMSATVASNAQSAEDATARSASVAEAARKSQEAMEALVAQMQAISGGSEQIASITSTIDSIATQTNLLALNAAVEAARAGEAGKGFAVVAAEVRELARRAGEAAAEINGLISTSRGDVSKGVERVEGARGLLGEVVGQIVDLEQLIENISGASREQATAVSEVSGTVSTLDQVTQENSRIADRTESMVQTLLRETGQLETLAARFQGAGGAGRRAA